VDFLKVHCNPFAMILGAANLAGALQKAQAHPWEVWKGLQVTREQKGVAQHDFIGSILSSV